MKKLAILFAFLIALSLPASTQTISGLPSPSNPSTCTTQATTNLCVTLPPYNASTAGATTTTVSGTFGVGTSGSVASCSTFLANQGVLIAGAGTAGGNYIGTVVSCSGTTLTVTPTTVTSVAASNVVQHDETAAFLAAITAIQSAGGGTIWVPDGLYLVNGPLLQTSAANAILPMPVIANYTSPILNVTISGFIQPEMGGASGGNPTSGAILKTAANTGNFFGGLNTAGGGGFAPFTNVKLTLNNLSLVGPTNPGIVMVNATSILAFQGSNLIINTVANTLPSNAAGGGIFLPALSNSLQISLDTINVSGFFTGFKIGEHANIGAIYGSFDVNTFVFDVGTNAGAAGSNIGNSISVAYLWTQHSTNGIVAGANKTTVNIAAADLEDVTGNGILDASNLLFGRANVNIPETSGSTTYCNANISGAANLKVDYLWCNNKAIPYVAGAGSVNVMTATYTPPISALTAGLAISVLPNLANTTTTPTLNVSGLGAKTITKYGTTALVASDYTTTAVANLIYDGTVWQLQNPQTAASGGISLTTTGTSGVATLIAGTLNVPNYGAGAGGAVSNITSSTTPTNCTIASGVCTTSGAVATVTLATVPAGFNTLEIVVSGACSAAAANDAFYIQFNGDTGSNYSTQSTATTNGTNSPSQATSVAHPTAVIVPCSTAAANSLGSATIDVYRYTGSTLKFGHSDTEAGVDTTNNTNFYLNFGSIAFVWRNTAAITSVTFGVSGGSNITAGSTFSVYGVN